MVETKLGLDLQGGLRVEYQALPQTVAMQRASCVTDADVGDLRRSAAIIERRVNSTGVSEPVVQTQGTDRIVVELPGVTEHRRDRKLVGQTGRLDFVPLPAAEYGTRRPPGPNQAVEGQPLPTTTEPPLFSGDQIDSANATTDQTGRAPSASP